MSARPAELQTVPASSAPVMAVSQGVRSHAAPSAPAVNPWDALARIASDPAGTASGPAGTGDDPAARLFIARALAFLGLPEPSRAWAGSVPADSEASPSARSLESQLDRLPPSVIADDDLGACLRANLLASRGRIGLPGLPVPLSTGSLPRDAAQCPFEEALDSFVRCVVERLSGTLYRSKDGNTVWLPGLATGGPPAAEWLAGVVDGRGRSGRAAMPSNQPQQAGAPSDPVAVLGLSPAGAGSFVPRVLGALPAAALGQRATIDLIEPNTDRAMAWLATSECTDWIGSQRCRWWIGPDALERVSDGWRASMGFWFGLRAVVDPGLPVAASAELVGWFERARQDASRAQSQELSRLRAWAAERDRQRDTGWWRERLARAMVDDSSKAEPIRAVIATSRFSTYVRHAAADIRAAFESMGGACELLIEPDDGSGMHSTGILGAIERLDADVFVTINHPRITFGELLPRSLPVVCWVQDAMPHLFNERVARTMGPHDLLVGSIFNEMVSSHGIPADRCLRMPVPASAAKFAVHTDRASNGAACDVLIASNHGETPEAMAERMELELVSNGGPRGLVLEIAERLQPAFDAWSTGWSSALLERVVTDALRARGSAFVPADIEEMSARIARPLLQRCVRHRMVHMAAELCERRGWELRVHGRGWDSVPGISAWARGELDHGGLAEAYACAAVTLHASPDWPTHQRIYECLFAGGMPATMLMPDHPAFVLGLARRGLEQVLVGSDPAHSKDPAGSGACDGLTVAADGSVAGVDHPRASQAIGLAQRMLARVGRRANPEVFYEERALLDGRLPVHAPEGLPRCPEGLRELVTPWAFIEMLSATEPMMFATPEQLECVVERARRDHAWRNAAVGHGVGVARRWFSYEGSVGAIIGMLHERASV